MNSVGKPRTLRKMNMEAVESLLRTCGPLTKPDLSRRTGLSLVTVGKAVNELIAQGRVLVAGSGGSTGGRKAQLYAFNHRQFCFLALYYYENRYACALADATGEIFWQEDWNIGDGPIVEQTLHCIEQVRQKAQDIPLAAVGVGVPGAVSGGVVTSIPSLPSLEGVKFGAVLERALNCPVWVENDIGLAAFGLYTDRFEKETDHLAYLYFGRGVGCGLVLNKRRFKGSLDFAGEVGCLPIEGTTLEQAFFHLRETLRPGETADPNRLKTLVGLAVNSLSCVLNPGIVAVTCDGLGPQQLADIGRGLTAPPERRPRLVLLEDVRRQCLQGVLHLCMQNWGNLSHRAKKSEEAAGPHE
ncbi:ROK family protein [uncultured Ruthenibacterium sp.]|uniref:ROK family protein n=1 Tax=uncultured Ruthenibacterium sp. TaxID=1905347 RepID=UPI00349E5140